ncbi:limbin-like isoform X3 [Salminus brasiliensis]|uniref:limbin-like isoform X3 n=1 Tax=Salminus brasiliensis TaxID=930266 RepID=UPI003B82FED9
MSRREDIRPLLQTHCLNDINLFGPVVANFTLRLNTTEKVSVNHALHFAGFCGALVVSTLLFSLTLFSTSCLYTKLCTHTPQNRRRWVLSGGAEPEEGVCNISESANEEAAFEDKVVDIMALEDPQNMFQALNNLEMSTLMRGALGVECVRVQVVRGVFRMLLGGAGAAGRRVVAVLLGQMTGMEGKLQEEQGAWLTSLAARCSMETQQEMETLHRAHASEKTHAEKVLQHTEQKELLECRVLLEKLQKMEQEHVQRGLLARREQASARAQRLMAIRRRAELHTIFTEELQEAARTGELDNDAANALLHQYYTCQNQLEEVLDLFVANQRAALSEQQAQRRFLVKGLQGLEGALCGAFSMSSQNINSWFAEIHREGVLSNQQCEEQLERAQLELLRVKQVLKETLSHQRSAAHCDIIKGRRARISETLCEQKREQQELEEICEGPVGQYLSRWQTLLSAHSTHYSELLAHLDQEAAEEMRKVLLGVLQEAGVELRAVGEGVARSLQALGVPRWLLQRQVGDEAMSKAQQRLRERWREAAAALRAARSSIHQHREQELQWQKHLRLRLDQYCRSVCGSQWALSEAELMRIRLECVKCVCRLDRCLVLSHTLTRARLYTALTDPPNQHTPPDLNTDHQDPCGTLTHTQKVLTSTERPLEAAVNAAEPGDVQSFRRKLEERIQLLQKKREGESSTVEEQVCMRENEEEQVQVCEEGVGVELAVVQWERAERRSRVLETHTALLTVHTLLLQHLRHTHSAQQLSHTLHTHSLALEEAELQLQKEEAEWEELVFGRGSDDMLPDDADDEELFSYSVDKSCSLVANLQDALYKRQELIHTLTARLQEAGRRQQVMEDLRDQLELKRLYTLCDQDLVLSAELVKISGVSVVVLQEILRLLLPTLPEGELQSLIDVLSPKAGQTAGPGRELVDRLRNDIISKNLSSCSQLTDQETDRLRKKKQNLVEKLFSSSPAGSSKGRLKISAAQLAAPSRPSSAPVQPARSRPGMGGARAEGVRPSDCTHGDEEGVAVESPVSGERLFISRSPLPAHQEPMEPTEHPEHPSHPSLHSRRNKKSFLGFRKGSVAPQEQT